MEIKTVEDLFIFSARLKSADIELPENVRLVVKLDEKIYNELVPLEYRNYIEAVFQSPEGYIFYIEKK